MKKMHFFSSHQLFDQQRAVAEPWLEFLQMPAMSAGMYVLAAGEEDGQNPHSEDEIYYIVAGQGHFICEGESRPVQSGDIIYVPAYADHRFYHIDQRLQILVFFAPAEGSLAQRGQLLAEPGYEVSTERGRLDLDFVHQFLTNSYWAQGISRERVTRSVENSLAYGVYHGQQQVGFGRVITDYATFAYISDVFIVEAYRGRGLSKMMLTAMMAHPELQGIRQWTLHTRDAHALYRQFGFIDPGHMPRYMEYKP